jgi:hypothetical protein
LANGLAEAQVRFPSVPLVFCETRPLAAEWAYRFLGAALDELASHDRADAVAAALPLGVELPPLEPTTAEVRAWAVAAGLAVSDRGRLRPEVWTAYRAAQD